MLITILMRNYRKYGTDLNSHDALKFIAILLMVVDHIGAFFMPDDLWWRAIGRWCVPIWFFLAGYARTFRIDKEMLTLACFLVVVDAVFSVPILPFNILFTMMAIRLYLKRLERRETWDVFDVVIAFAIFSVLMLPTLLFFEYGTVAFFFALAGYLSRRFGNEALPAKVALALAVPAFIGSEIVDFNFKFSPSQIALMGIGVLGMAIILFHFRPKTYQNILSNGLKSFVVFIGRNSLHFYAIHLTIFVLIRYLLEPPIEWSFRLIS